LLPAQHVRAYVRRNKTDAADAAALIEASRSGEIKPVAIKSIDQQVLPQLHRLRTAWQAGRTSRINSLRGMLREFGIDVPVGAVRGLAVIREHLQFADNRVHVQRNGRWRGEAVSTRPPSRYRCRLAPRQRLS
jgi:transposase